MYSYMQVNGPANMTEGYLATLDAQVQIVLAAAVSLNNTHLIVLGMEGVFLTGEPISVKSNTQQRLLSA